MSRAHDFRQPDLTALLVKHMTSSVFVFRRADSRILLALLWHTKLRRWMIPGGHVEPNESPAEAAQREVTEETDLRIRWISPPHIVPDAFDDCDPIPVPWWVVEQEIPPSQLEHAHKHVDHLFLAWVDDTSGRSVRRPPRLKWVDTDELDDVKTFHGTKVLARRAFAQIHESDSQASAIDVQRV